MLQSCIENGYTMSGEHFNVSRWFALIDYSLASSETVMRSDSKAAAKPTKLDKSNVGNGSANADGKKKGDDNGADKKDAPKGLSSVNYLCATNINSFTRSCKSY